MPARGTSPATERANALVDARRPAADALGQRLAELVHDPTAFGAALREGFEELADAEYPAGQQFVAPGIGPVLGVRLPLITATARSLRSATQGVSTVLLLDVAARLLRDDVLEPRWFAFRILERTVATDPERTWQLLRLAARDAADWITVDSLAHPIARGILLEPFRWAEIELLVFSRSRWERRLVGSTIATMPFVDRKAGRTRAYVARALPILAQLIGDADPDVQKALSWAYRSVAMVDPDAAAHALELEARTAATTTDGNRAWVVRDSLGKLDGPTADRLRESLRGIRRTRGASATSRAAETADRFSGGASGPAPQTNVR